MNNLKEALYRYSTIPEEQQKIRTEILDIMSDKNNTDYTISAMILSDMPRSNNVCDPTYQLYMRIRKVLEMYERQIERKQEEYQALERKKEYVESLLSRLTWNEEKVIRAVFFKGVRRWETIARETHYSVRQCQRIEEATLKTILKMSHNVAIG
jgi:DNA repair protein RadC